MTLLKISLGRLRDNCQIAGKQEARSGGERGSQMCGLDNDEL